MIRLTKAEGRGCTEQFQSWGCDKRLLPGAIWPEGRGGAPACGMGTLGTRCLHTWSLQAWHSPAGGLEFPGTEWNVGQNGTLCGTEQNIPCDRATAGMKKTPLEHLWCRCWGVTCFFPGADCLEIELVSGFRRILRGVTRGQGFGTFCCSFPFAKGKNMREELEQPV